MTSQEGMKAQEDAQKIHERLQQLRAEYPNGLNVNKSELRFSFDIPVTRAVKVWYELRKLGYGLEHKFITVRPSKEAKKPIQEKDEEDDLDAILND